MIKTKNSHKCPFADFESVESAAMALGLSVSSVCEYCRTGRLPGALKYGKKWVIPKKSVDYYKANRRPVGRPSIC